MTAPWIVLLVWGVGFLAVVALILVVFLVEARDRRPRPIEPPRPNLDELDRRLAVMLELEPPPRPSPGLRLIPGGRDPWNAA